MRQLFGTDGIRGVAGEYPLDQKTVFAIGRALGQRLAARDEAARVIIGQDTRESSSVDQRRPGGWVWSPPKSRSSAPELSPRQAVAYLTRTNKFAAGIVISASHNPWQDNGIKIFGADGYKLSDELEHAIEADIFAHIEQLAAAASHNAVPDCRDASGRWQAA